MDTTKAALSATISLDNLDGLQQQWAEKGNLAAPQPILNSPRSLEACKRAGVNPSIDLAKPNVVEILREISNGATWPLSTEGLTPQKAAVLELIPLPGRQLGSFEEKRAAVEKYQHLEARRTTTIRMLQEIRQQLVAAEEFAARKANPNYKKMPAMLPPTAGSPKRAVPQLPLRRMPHHKGHADDEESLVSISTATASEMPRPSNGTSTHAFLASRRLSGNRAASPSSSESGDDSSDCGVELIHITTTGREDTEGTFQLPPSPKAVPPPTEIYDRTEALKERGLHRTIKTPSTRTAATNSPPRPSPKLPPSSPPRPAPDQTTQDLVARVLEREAVTRAAHEVHSRSRETSPQPRQQSEVSSSSSPSRFETNRHHRRQLIDQAIAFRAQQVFPKISSPNRADLVSPAAGDAYNYRSSAARIGTLSQKSPGASVYA